MVMECGSQTVTKLTVGRRIVYVNRSPLILDVPVMMIRGEVYVPVRFPAQALGACVTWDGATKTVTITRPTTTKTTRPAKKLPPIQPNLTTTAPRRRRARPA